MLRNQTYPTAIQTMGDTPLIKLNNVVPDGGGTVLVKCEFFNPLNSVKDRIGVAMIEAGELDGSLNADTHVVEPTSGNTGIALAFVCAAKGYRLTLTMPESMSVERRALLRQLGAQLVLTPAAEGMKGAISKAAEIVASEQNAWMPQQFENPANPAVHEATTGPEIWDDTNGDVAAVVAGVGTGGTITGTSRFLKSQNPDVLSFAVEPDTSAVISGEEPGKHQIQGIGAGFIPGNLDTTVIDETITVSSEESFQWSRRLAKEEGIMAGISSGANVCAAAKIAARPDFAGKTIVTFLPSLGERYLSTPLFNEND
jgi:cysteine synthase A